MHPICSEINVILYIEHELPESEMLRMEQHIAHCPTCRGLLQEHRLIRNALQHACDVRMSEDLLSHVMAEIPIPLRNFLTTSRERIVAVAATIAFALVGLMSYIVGAQARTVADIVSLKWWNGVLLNIFSVVIDGFMFVLHLVRILGSVGLFFVEGLTFILKNLGQALVLSPQVHVLFAVLAVFFVTTFFLASRIFQPHFRKLN
ncbi:MAG: zf-HC2 domain-containing protein [Acidobacteria bacterium]|nr:zf-HC2 domain-containing protein [Acidobacteriota bacterium]